MANTKITSLTDIAATPASNDVIPIVDVSDTTQASTGTTKKITANRFVFQDSGTVSSTLNFSGNNTFSGTVIANKLVPPSNSAALITYTNPTTTTPLFDLVTGNTSGLIMRLSDVTADATAKQARYATRHYTNSEKDVMMYYSSNTANNNILSYGGNSSLFNAVTIHSFYTGTAINHPTGVETFRISSGSVTAYKPLIAGSALTVTGTATIDALKINQTPTAGTFTNTHYITVNLNGTTYRIPCAV